MLTLLFALVVTCFGQSISNESYTSVKSIVGSRDYGESFSIKASFVKVIDFSEVTFSVEEEEYIIPIELLHEDLGAEKRLRNLDLQPGDTLIINGSLQSIFVGAKAYNGLTKASIICVRRIDMQPPMFLEGGLEKFAYYVASNVQYPKRLKDEYARGRVNVSFTVDTDGRIVDIKVLSSPFYEFSEEAVRVVKNSPKWTPGYKNGQLARFTYTIPVYFMP